MVINIKATLAKLTPQAHEIINKKIAGLAKFYPNIIQADVELGLTSMHHQTGNIYRAEVNLTVPKKVLRAEAETDDIMKSINKVKDILQNELKKYKEMTEE